MTSRPAPPDQAARDCAILDLNANLLVEAGAGSGKTTLLATRMAGLVESGVPTARIAAVTFTRKASGELRERFQLALEKALERARTEESAERVERLTRALDSLDDAFLGTIHSFCGRLLRERPIEAGLDPGFRELEETESKALAEEWWGRWLERCHIESDADLRRLGDVGLQPEQFFDAFEIFDRYPDVDFASAEVAAPDVGPCRTTLESLLDRAMKRMPREEPSPEWDDLQITVKALWHEKQNAGWKNDGWTSTAGFCDALALMGSCDAVQKRWVRNGDDTAAAKEAKAAAKELEESFKEFKGGEAARVLAAWRAHRYPLVVRFLQRAAREFAAARVAAGTLGFEDLLVRAAELLERDANARRKLGERFQRVLVDEFQDTDPVQARVLFLLASDPGHDKQPGDWTSVKLREGALFIVGDPKQSIYRFRRADIEIYAAAKAMLAEQGQVLTLTANFRSVPAVAEFVNEKFGDSGIFPAVQTAEQAAFAPMNPMRVASGAAGVSVYELVAQKANPSRENILHLDAPRVASFIAGCIARGERQPQDFLVLARRKSALAAYAKALAEHNVPVTVTGANVAYEAELHEMELVLRLLADPSNPVLTAAALEGVFVGATPADLWAARQAGLSFQVAIAPTDAVGESVESDANAGHETAARVARVRNGLERLHGWLVRARHTTADELLETILDESGLLALTAAGELGDARAGMLLELVQQIRAATLDTELGPAAALRTLERLSASESPDASLRPGRTDAVRVMNLHKAKGLEAPVVVLAAPLQERVHEPKMAVRREGTRAIGGILVEHKKKTLAHPADWNMLADVEKGFLRAEHDRLLYVATTRAKDELVVSRLWETPKGGVPALMPKTAWSALNDMLELRGRRLQLEPANAPGRGVVAREGADIAADVRSADAARARAAEPGYAFTTVTRSAKEERADPMEPICAGSRSAGVAWGRAVHRIIQWMGEHEDRGGLSAAVAAIAGEEELDAATGAEALSRTAADLQQREEWRELEAAGEKAFEWPVAEWRARADGVMELVEGVIDAAYRKGDAWVVLDWKTDASDAAWSAREPQYQQQVGMYAAMLARATALPAVGKLVRVTLAG